MLSNKPSQNVPAWQSTHLLPSVSVGHECPEAVCCAEVLCKAAMRVAAGAEILADNPSADRFTLNCGLWYSLRDVAWRDPAPPWSSAGRQSSLSAVWTSPQVNWVSQFQQRGRRKTWAMFWGFVCLFVFNSIISTECLQYADFKGYMKVRELHKIVGAGSGCWEVACHSYQTDQSQGKTVLSACAVWPHGVTPLTLEPLMFQILLIILKKHNALVLILIENIFKWENKPIPTHRQQIT